MELLTTAAILGGLYVASNQEGKIETPEKEVVTEGFTEKLPGTDLHRVNYPVIAPVSKDNINYYEDSNQATDKYFDQTNYQNTVAAGDNNSSNIQEIFSLSGQTIDKSEFVHNNMVPFFGAKIK